MAQRVEKSIIIITEGAMAEEHGENNGHGQNTELQT